MSKSVLKVKSLFHEYIADFTGNIEAEMEILLNKENVHFIVDSDVFRSHKDRMQYISKAVTFIEIEADEKNKTIETAQQIMLKLLKNNISKSDVLVVVGGGLTQDIGAFVAHILKRGIKWYFIPTTLLAMCDSCIGSKYGINMAGFKNQIGGFYPPTKVFIDMEYLKTLKKEDLISGVGEILKVHLISGEDDFNNLEKKHDQILTEDPVLKYFIFRSLEIKKAIVEKDEFDKDYRHILNYGHTFGHSIEACTHNAIPHGIGVTIGMEIANYISVKKGYLAEDVFDKASSLLRQYIPYASLGLFDHGKMTEALTRDKKFDGKKLNVILSKGIGKIFKDRIDIDEKFLMLIDSYTRYYNNTKNTSVE